MPERARPRILVAHASVRGEPLDGVAVRKVAWYLDAIRRHGGEPVGISPETGPTGARAMRGVRGLLLTGGADIDPARYGEAPDGSRAVTPIRDALEAALFEAAEDRGLPVLGICRGHQAINVFSGGSLVQHVDGHDGPAPGDGPARRHPLHLLPGSRLASALGSREGGMIEVNSYHHQAVTPERLAPSLAASAFADADGFVIVEGLERPGPRFVVGVQCHPERRASTPAAFEALFDAFVEAARG